MPTNPQPQSGRHSGAARTSVFPACTEISERRHSHAKRTNLLFALAAIIAFTLTAQAQLPPEPATVRIGVLSLFHPHILTLTADHPLTLSLDGTPHILDAHQAITLQSTPSGLTAGLAPFQTLTLNAQTFTLIVPDKLTRTYRGALTVTAHNGILIPVIAMDTETAVASIVAAESPPNAPLEALKAQAIVSRSFLLANPQAHALFDACDTTHCQFLRSPPPPNSPAAIATRATRNTVLTWRPAPDTPPQIVRAMYSRSCGGRTSVPNPRTHPGAYPFYSVRCSFCLRHPELKANSHGIGLCQLGAADLARHGMSAEQIVKQYFPNTTFETLP